MCQLKNRAPDVLYIKKLKKLILCNVTNLYCLATEYVHSTMLKHDHISNDLICGFSVLCFGVRLLFCYE